MVEDIATAALPATWMKTAAVMGRCAAMALSWRRLPPFWTVWIWSLNNRPALLPLHNSLGGHCLPVMPAAASTRTSRTCKETELAFRYFPLCHHIYHPICEEEKWWWDDQEPNLTVALCILIHFLLPSPLEWLQPLQPLGSWCAELLNFHKCQAIETNDDTHRPLILPTHSVWKLLKKVLFYNSSMNNFTQFGQNGNSNTFEHQKNIIFGGKNSNDFFFLSFLNNV